MTVMQVGAKESGYDAEGNPARNDTSNLAF